MSEFYHDDRQRPVEYWDSSKARGGGTWDLPLERCSLVERVEKVESTSHRESLPSSTLSTLSTKAWDAVDRWKLPAADLHNRYLFQLARSLRALGGQARDYHGAVARWHASANTDKSMGETMSEFLRLWDAVKYPEGEDSFSDAAAAAEQLGVPPELNGLFELGDPLIRLANLCRALQRTARDGPFYLGCDKAAAALGIGSGSAWNLLRGLERYGLIETVKKGDRYAKGTVAKATRYLYTGVMHDEKDRLPEGF